MSETDKKLTVERISRDFDTTVQYRIRLTVSYTLDSTMDDIVPDKVVSGYLANVLREFVNSACLDDHIVEHVERYRKKAVFTCPTCGKEYESR